MKILLGILIGLVLAVSIAAASAYIACDGDFRNSCGGEDFSITFSDD
ncbi:hypothetical protein PUV54_01215 [Hyphococcus flavus]|uniref:Uncharacterized protein n=1 Tax=Hyphococcus flavus TaxID=1866326 RepID=A0AAE9ZDU9_9PROT|nr:hypothetical protein [Hyphococcus flavus]WDI31805.1 hypothetical protein PUV54_01215 [Hyphococcus flavus]